MKIRVSYIVDVSDDYRRAVRVYYGKPGLATRAEVKRWFEQYGSSMDDDLMHSLQVAEAPKGEPQQGSRDLE